MWNLHLVLLDPIPFLVHNHLIGGEHARLHVYLTTCAIAFYYVIYYSVLAYSAVDCGDPGTPTNGQRSLSSTTYNSVVTYTCDVGYTLQGSNSKKCLYTGQWKGSVPLCIGKF